MHVTEPAKPRPPASLADLHDQLAAINERLAEIAANAEPKPSRSRMTLSQKVAAVAELGQDGYLAIDP